MMLTTESSGSVLANVTPLAAGATGTNSCGTGGERRQLGATSAVTSRNDSSLGKGRQYSVKTFVSLAVAVLLLTGCPEKPVDAGALITARTVGLDYLQRGQLADAEEEFKKVIAIAPRDPLGHANLGLT